MVSDTVSLRFVGQEPASNLAGYVLVRLVNATAAVVAS
jgi:hypothetical protein